MSYPHLRIHGQDVTDKPMHFITTIRVFISTNLASAKEWVDEFRTHSQLELSMPSDDVARQLGGELLRSRFVTNAWLIRSPEDAGMAIPMPPPHPSEIKYLCPDCQAALRFPYECKGCDWLRFPGDRALWTSAGACPKCGFSYRWDGAHCSHCGEGSVEYPPVVAPNP